MTMDSRQRYVTDEQRWEAVAARDRAADGSFIFSVRTTGVFCRPSCPARAPRRENVAFHPDADAARAAGFRACKRCRPEGAAPGEDQTDLVAAACRIIDGAEGMPRLDDLATAVGLSPHHFHRVFKRETGLTPRAYAAAKRGEAARRELKEASSVTDAIYGSGFNAPSRFYEASRSMLGMLPSAYRAGGEGERIRFAIGACSLGAVLVASTARGVCAVLLGDDPEPLLRDLQDRFPKADLVGGDGDFERTVATVVGLIERPQDASSLPLDVRGTAFQQRVWDVLRKVPAGETVSYAEVAARVGAPSASRAVAQACAANPVAVAIPCHRVVRADGALSGYRWGVERKRSLLERESEKA